MTLPEVVQNIRLSEVAAALRGLEPGPYPARELYERYIEACRAAGYAGGYPRQLGMALNAMGIDPPRYHPDLGEPGRLIDPVALAARWPHLPWTD